MKIHEIKFEKSNKAEFVKELRSRVNEYFATRGISRFGNWSMITKSAVMIALYYIPYGLMVGGVFESTWAIFACWMLMAAGMSGIGLSIMHDANHGAYSKHKWVNTAMNGNYPWVIQVKIICGGGYQILSETVDAWIREKKNVSNAPKSCH